MKLGFPKPGTFMKNNGHNGMLWGYKKECNMTDKKAGKILLALIKTRKLTMSQLGLVLKSLAYSGICNPAGKVTLSLSPCHLKLKIKAFCA